MSVLLLGIREGVYCQPTKILLLSVKGTQQHFLFKENRRMCVCVSVLYCMGVCGRREKREAEKQAHTLIHSHIHAREEAS